VVGSVADELHAEDDSADDDMISGVDVIPTSDDVKEEDHSDVIFDDSTLADDSSQSDEVPSTAAFVDSPKLLAGEVGAVETPVLVERAGSTGWPTGAAAVELPVSGSRS